MENARGAVWDLVAALGVAAIAVSCADGVSLQGPSCVAGDCANQCRAVGHPGGECRSDACYCLEPAAADAGADVVDVASSDDGAERADTPDRADDALHDDGAERTDIRDEAGDRPDLADMCCLPPDAYDAKSGCDPMLCFLSCGGTCLTGGVCVCESTRP